MTENTGIPDLWTDSQCYADLYQNDDQIRVVCELLELPSATSVVDIGCGNGVFAVAVASQFPNCAVVALDSLASATEETEQRASSANCKNMRTEVASADALPIPNVSADRILMRNVAHHLSSLDAAFAEVSRILLPGGIFLLEVPCNPGDSALAELISDIHMLMDNSHRRAYHSPKAVAICMDNHGMTPSEPKCWPYSFPVDSNQIELIKNRKADGLLSLDESIEEQASIQLTLTRIIGRKRES
jgi:ubiquinone/menaquinone biosynthesis C-methylase UbiE